MRELIEKLEKAGAGSRELDAAFADAFGYPKTLLCGEPVLGNERWLADRAPQVTTSLDAALALAERVLPGWSRGVFEDEPGNRPPWLATLTEVCDARAVEEHEGAGATAPLALCLAILRATQSQHTVGGGVLAAGEVETGWLVESDENGPLYHPTRTRNATEAMRFCRQQDAEAFIRAYGPKHHNSILTPAWRAVEHRWG